MHLAGNATKSWSVPFTNMTNFTDLLPLPQLVPDSISSRLMHSEFLLSVFNGPDMDESDTLAANDNVHMIVTESQNQANTIVLIQWLAPITSATCPCI